MEGKQTFFFYSAKEDQYNRTKRTHLEKTCILDDEREMSYTLASHTREVPPFAWYDDYVLLGSGEIKEILIVEQGKEPKHESEDSAIQ